MKAKELVEGFNKWSPDDIPKATHESVQEFLGVPVRFYVLDDGRRIINADDFHKLMAVMGLDGSDQ